MDNTSFIKRVLVVVSFFLLAGMNSLAQDNYGAEVKSLWPVKAVETGTSVVLWAQVDNTGSSNLDSGCTVVFWVRAPGKNPVYDNIIGSRPCSANDDLKSNSHTGAFTPSEGLRWYKLSFTPPTPGTYKYWAAVYMNGQKMSGWSQEMSFSVPLTGQILGLYKVENAKAGTPVVLWANAKNSGVKNLNANCYVEFYVKGGNTDGTVGSRPCTVNDWKGNSGPLAPGESRWYKAEFTPYSAGAYTYWAVVYRNGERNSEWSQAMNFNVV